MASTGKVEGDFPVYFRYTAGIAGERFLRELKENGKLVATRCSKCSLDYLPPRIFCERCMAKLTEYVDVRNEGIVESLTLCMRDSAGNRLSEPVGVAFVRFQSAYGGLIHRTKGPVSIGDRVRVVLKDKSQRTGSILDIEYFDRLK